MRHPGKTELQRSAQDVGRENRADQRCEPSEQHQHEDRRHDDVGENDPHHAIAEADNQGEAKQQRRHRARECEGAELGGSVLHAQNMKGDEGEADREGVEQDELQRQRVTGGFEQPV